MFKKIRGPDHHFNAFYEDNAILIQFMMTEFIQFYQLTFKIKTLIEELYFTPNGNSFLSLIQILGELIGCPRQQARSSFSEWAKGPLTKFKEYSEQFSRNSLHQNKQHVDLHLTAQQAWLIAIHALELLNSLHLNPYTSNPSSIVFSIPLKRAFRRLEIRLNQICRCLPLIMRSYWDNENIILYLLRKKDLLSEIYGNNFLNKQFKIPLKGPEVVKLVVERYQARGFESLLSNIDHVFLGLR